MLRTFKILIFSALFSINSLVYSFNCLRPVVKSSIANEKTVLKEVAGLQQIYLLKKQKLNKLRCEYRAAVKDRKKDLFQERKKESEERKIDFYHSHLIAKYNKKLEQFKEEWKNFDAHGLNSSLRAVLADYNNFKRYLVRVCLGKDHDVYCAGMIMSLALKNYPKIYKQFKKFLQANNIIT